MESRSKLSEWVVYHKNLIIPLLGSKIREELEATNDIQSIQQYEKLSQPSGVLAELKPHQVEGISFLNYLRNNKAHGILGDEMGLGKTLQVLSFFQHLVNTDSHDKRSFLVVCPLSVLGTWMKETTKWTGLRAIQYYGSREKRRELTKVISQEGVDLVVTTYETLVSDPYRLASRTMWKAVVLDEGHKIRYDGKKSASSVSRLKTDQKIILTGTPIQNNLVEVWAMIKWLYPEIFGGKGTSTLFREAFSLGDGKVDTEFIHHVRKFLEVIMIRRTKESGDVELNLPPKTEVVLYAPLTGLQRSLYLGVVAGVGNISPTQSTFSTPPPTPGSIDEEARSYCGQMKAPLNPLMELRKICTHPLLLKSFQDQDDQDAELDVTAMSAKFIILKRLLQQVVCEERKKALIFSGFDGGLDCCEDLLDQLGIDYLRLDGSTFAAVRKYNIHLFNKEERFKVFLIATKAGGEGVTLTAAEVVVFLELDWNPQMIRQAEARAHRIGQTKPVTVYKLCTRGTVEDQMVHRLNKKLYLDVKVNSNFVNQTGGQHSNGCDDVTISDAEVIRDLIRASIRSVAVEQTDAEQMLAWDWNEILSYCTVASRDYENDKLLTAPSTPQHGFEDETTWLSTSARIQTDFFHGMRIPRSQLTPSDEFHIETKGKRIVKARVVFNKEYGYPVSKESMLCGEWEAVPTLANKDPRLANYKAPQKSKFGHQNICVVCRKSRCLTNCSYCPRAYHEKCHSKAKQDKFGSNSCPYHKCAKCLQTAPEAGGLLFNCFVCPRAFCVECVDLDTMLLLSDELAGLKTLGFEQPKHMKHVVCGDCAGKARTLLHSKRRVDEEMEATTSKRACL